MRGKEGREKRKEKRGKGKEGKRKEEGCLLSPFFCCDKIP